MKIEQVGDLLAKHDELCEPLADWDGWPISLTVQSTSACLLHHLSNVMYSSYMYSVSEQLCHPENPQFYSVKIRRISLWQNYV